MRIMLNGESRDFPEGLTIAALIQILDLGQRRLAVLHNSDVVRREDHVATVLADGDNVEIVQMVGGG